MFLKDVIPLKIGQFRKNFFPVHPQKYYLSPYFSIFVYNCTF